MPRTRNSCNNPMVNVLKKISPCFVHFREAVLFNHMRMMYQPRTEDYYQSQMLRGGIITTLEAQRCEKANPDKRKKM